MMRRNVRRKAGCAVSDSSAGVFRKGWRAEQESALPGRTPEAVLGCQERAKEAVQEAAESAEERGQSGEPRASVGRYGAALNICRREDLYKMSLGVLMMLPRDSFQS
jgi:hypothetical protein